MFASGLRQSDLWLERKIKVKSRAKMVNAAFAHVFTTPCKPLCTCGIQHLCLWFPPRLHFFAPYLLIFRDYVDPVLTSQSYNISISTRRTNVYVLLVLMLMLMSPVFSLAYKCACAHAHAYAYAYAYALVKTRLKLMLHGTIHNVAMLKQCYNYSKQCRNAVLR